MNTINPYMLFIGCNVPNWLMQSDIVSQGAKLCYGRLCQYSGADGRCFPKKVTLAKDLGVTKSGAWKYVEELKKALLIDEKDGHFVFLSHNLISEESFRRETKVSYRKPEVSYRKPLYNEENQLRESIREEQPTVIKTKIPLEATNYFFTKYKERYKTNYLADRGRFIKQFQKLDSDLTIDSFKSMIDKFIDCGGNDLQKFIWDMPKLATKIVKKPTVDGFDRYKDTSIDHNA